MNIRNWLDTSAKVRLWKNFFSLSLLQATSYILPLLTIPYLFRVLGAEQFGILAFVTATVGYLGLLVDYGFNWSATRLVALTYNTPEILIRHVNGVFQAKILLVVFSGITLLLAFFLGLLASNALLYVLAFASVVFTSFMPLWFYQGIEEMKHILIANVSSRVLFTLLTFIFVNSPGDVWMVPFFTAVGASFALIYSMYLMRVRYKIRLLSLSTKEVFFYVKDGFRYFTANMAISLYTISNVFILGLFASAEVVGYYSAAERLIRAGQSLFIPASQAVFPYVIKKSEKSAVSAISFLRKLLIASSFVMVCVGLTIVIFGETIAFWIFGSPDYLKIAYLLSIMSFIPFLVSMSNIFGIQIMLNLGYKTEFNYILWGAALLGISLSLFLVPMYQEVASALLLVGVEGTVTFLMFLFLRYRKVI